MAVECVLDVGANAGQQNADVLQCELAVQHIYEASPHYTEMLKHLESKGFNLVDLIIITRLPTGGVLEHDCVMAR